ncbi:MAG: peptide chain release factor 1 [Candidatus Ratteibacteria bacterium]|nr:peptide chain release factor 1 [Candidatus Ratteibacteria bacterium]
MIAQGNLEKIRKLESRFLKIEKLLADQQTLNQLQEYKKLSKEFSEIKTVVEKFRLWKKLDEELKETRELTESKDREMACLAKEEIEKINTKREKVEGEITVLLNPPDPDAKRNAIVEIRAGTGGEEASLFAAALFRMYSKFAETKQWHIEVMNTNFTGKGGMKEIIFEINGVGAYGSLRYESGIHRVQRVPVTESSGRIHTSAATVAVFPEIKEQELVIEPKDIRVDVFRSSGCGGQSVNTTDSAVRITYLPTGTVVTCQDERSQYKNKSKALRVLRARLNQEIQDRKQKEISKLRKTQVGSGDRSEKIRTYNFPQNRLTDHRFNLTFYRLNDILDGNLEELFEALQKALAA